MDACDGASWGGGATGLGVAVGAVSSRIVDVHGSTGGGLGWLVGRAELEVKMANVDQARVRERAMDARQGEGGGGLAGRALPRGRGTAGAGRAGSVRRQRRPASARAAARAGAGGARRGGGSSQGLTAERDGC